MAADYLKVIYSEKNTPKTDYPDKLVHYLFHKYNMSESQKILEPGELILSLLYITENLNL